MEKSWYGKTTKKSLYEIAKPISRIGIGIDKLPSEVIKEEEILTGSDLAIIASIEKIPNKQDFPLRNNKNTSEKHILAKAFLNEKKFEEAANFIITNLKKNTMSFKLPELPYDYDALEPHIDAKTMEIHHSKHHNGYTTNLNNAIEGTSFENKTIEEICTATDLPSAVRNNGGGYYNHNLFWKSMSPNGGGEPNRKFS